MQALKGSLSGRSVLFLSRQMTSLSLMRIWPTFHEREKSHLELSLTLSLRHLSMPREKKDIRSYWISLIDFILMPKQRRPP